MNIAQKSVSSRDIARAVIARAKERRGAQVLAIMDDGTVRMSPASKIEAERLIENHRDQYVGTYNAASDEELVVAEVRDRVFELIYSRMRAAEQVRYTVTPAGKAALGGAA